MKGLIARGLSAACCCFFIEGVLAESDTYLGLCLTSVVERFGKIMNS